MDSSWSFFYKLIDATEVLCMIIEIIKPKDSSRFLLSFFYFFCYFLYCTFQTRKIWDLIGLNKNKATTSARTLGGG
jgi:hypothetical protein